MPRNPKAPKAFWDDFRHAEVMARAAKLEKSLEGSPRDVLLRIAANATAVMEEYGAMLQRARRPQQVRAQKPRKKLADDLTVMELICRLARDQDATALELWNEFQGELDRRLLDPKLDEASSDKDKGRISYDTKDGRDSMTFKTFKNSVSASRGRK